MYAVTYYMVHATEVQQSNTTHTHTYTMDIIVTKKEPFSYTVMEWWLFSPISFYICKDAQK